MLDNCKKLTVMCYTEVPAIAYWNMEQFINWALHRALVLLQKNPVKSC